MDDMVVLICALAKALTYKTQRRVILLINYFF